MPAMFFFPTALPSVFVVRGKKHPPTKCRTIARRVQARENIEILYQTEIRKMLRKKARTNRVENTQTGERRWFKRRLSFPGRRETMH